MEKNCKPSLKPFFYSNDRDNNVNPLRCHKPRLYEGKSPETISIYCLILKQVIIFHGEN